MTSPRSAYLLIVGLCAGLGANPSLAIDPTVLIVDQSPVPGQPGYVNLLPSHAVIRSDGQAAWGAGGSLFEGDGVGLVVRHSRDSHLTGVPLGWGVAADRENLAASESGDLAFGGFLLSDGGTTSQGYALFGSDASQNFTMLFRQGDPAPGLPSGTRFGSFVTDLGIDDAGGLVVRVPLETPTGPPFAMSIWFRGHYGSLSMLIQEGQTPPGAPLPIAQTSKPLINRDGEIAFFATDSSGADLIVVSDSAGALRTLIREGDANPAGMIGTNLRAICCGQPFRPIAWSASGVVFAALLEVGVGGVGVDNDAVIVASDGSGGLRVVAREGEPIPGRPGVVWGQLNSAVNNDAGAIAIHQAYTSFDKEIVLHLPDADPILIAKDGQFAPGFPPGISIGDLGADNGLLFLNDAGAISFVARAQPASGFPSRLTRFVRTAAGVLSRVAATGDVVEVAPGDFRVVSDFSIGSLDEAGNVLLDLFQTSPWGGNVGMATAIYAVPEPDVTCMVPIGAMMIALANRGRRPAANLDG